MNEKDKVKPKSTASSTAYHNFLQSVNDNDRTSIKSDDVSYIQSARENGEHFSEPKSLPKPRYTNDDVATPITDAQSIDKKDDVECTLQHTTSNDSLDTSHAVNKEYITQDIMHTTESKENGSVDVAHITTDNDHQEIDYQLSAPPGPINIPATS